MTKALEAMAPCHWSRLFPGGCLGLSGLDIKRSCWGGIAHILQGIAGIGEAVIHANVSKGEGILSHVRPTHCETRKPSQSAMEMQPMVEVEVAVGRGMGEECIHLAMMETGGFQTCKTTAWSSAVIKSSSHWIFWTHLIT